MINRNLKLVGLLLVLTFSLAACGRDEIIVVDDTAGGGSSPIDIIDPDDIDTNYDRTVTVLFSNTGIATVSGTSDSVIASVSSNDVIIRNYGTERVFYRLTGSTSNGYFKVYSGRKQAISLNNVSIANQRGAAINVQGYESTPNKGKRVDLILNGSNTLADGSSYSLTPSGEDEKAVLFGEGQIIVSGNGSLTVNATGKAGITSDDYVAFVSGCIVNVSSSAGHGVRGKDYVLVSGGTLNVNVSADGKKGFSSDSLVRFDGGVTTIAITGNTIVSDGDTNGTAGVKADQIFEMNNGTLTITNTGKGGKGISCDGPAYFRGGSIDITVTGANFGSSSGGGPGGGWPGGGGGWGGSDNSVGAKGIKCDGNIDICGGVVTVKASNHEGIETKGSLTISGGQVYSQSSDDAINSASTMTISGGYVLAYSTGNDGLDANGNCYVQGGVVYAIGKNSPEMAIDANTEDGYRLYVQGGTLIAIGSLENGAQLTQACYQSSSWTKNVWYSITVGDETHAFKTPASGGTKLVVSGAQQPVVRSGVTVSGGTEICNSMLTINPTVSGGSSVSLTGYSGGGWH